MIDALRVQPGEPARIRERDARDTLGLHKGRCEAAARLLARAPQHGEAVAVAQLLLEALERMNPQLPDAEPGVEGVHVE